MQIYVFGFQFYPVKTIHSNSKNSTLRKRILRFVGIFRVNSIKDTLNLLCTLDIKELYAAITIIRNGYYN